MTEHPEFYAEIEVREWGEEPRYQWIGPFSTDTAEEAEENLRARGDDVIRIVTAEEYASEVVKP